MSMFFAESFDYKGANVLHRATAGNATTYVGYLPTYGVKTINMFCWMYFANATAAVVNVQYADDSSGTNATAIAETVNVWLEGTKGTAAKALTFPATLTTSANYTGVIQVPANLVPAGKYIGLALTAGGNSNNLLYAIAIEDTYYKG